MRKSWFPPLAKLNASADPLAFQDKFVIYNLESGTYKSVEIKGLPAGTDRAFHGIDLFETSPSDLVIFLINHRRGGSVVEVLEYKIGDDFVTHKETVKHELILTPNDIVALGPRSFYVSNDHKYAKGVMREIELSLRKAWADVIYHSPEETFVAFPGVASANGMTATPDRSTVYLSACHGGGMHVLKPHADHTLEQEEYIKFDFFVDNPSYDVDTGSVFLAGHVQPLLFTGAMNYPGKPVIGPSKIVKISKKKAEANAPSSASRSSYKVETVLVDDGHQISTSTTAALDRQRNVMLVGTAVAVKGLHRCPIPEGF
ncbi:Serum paraoxonase/arylesterase 2 [Podila clonocystis]|nr:Serum paraoxonase/arylesterase 2 [Podila clonocystis]